jgi:hypothetical protein
LDIKPSSTTLSASVLTSQANQYAMLMKCFVERSFKSGRGKIISVCKDGLNDQLAFVANASLWDANNQCKPAFYAVVDVGIYYNKLDSLITHINTLNQNDYTGASWTNLSTILTAARSVKNQNYSYSTSAATDLKTSFTDLNNGVKNLVRAGTDVNGEGDNLPKVFSLSQNYPNPFNPSTIISYQLPESGNVTLKIYDVLGNEVATLVNEFKNAGFYNSQFSILHYQLTSGVYFYCLKANNFVATKKFVLVK